MTSTNFNCLFFVIISFIRKDKLGKICLQKFTKFCVDITFWYILTFKIKCCKLLTSFVYVVILTFNTKCCVFLTSSLFVVRFVNDIVELELSFL